jgi:hypothetical protein
MNGRLRWLQAASLATLCCLFTGATPARAQASAPEAAPETASTPATEADVLDACINSYEQAQRLRKSGDLTAARDALMACSRDTCPDIAKTDCTRWLAEVRQDMPSIVVGARFGDGRDAIEVTVMLDGKPLTERLDGHAIELNPGVHVLRFETKGRAPVEERVSIRVGERNRRIMATFADPTPPAPPPPPPQGIPAVTYVLGGVGVLGLAGFGFFGATGLSKESDLDQCKPSCPSNEVDAVRTRYLLADISLAVGAVALGGASYFYFTRDSGSPEQDRGVAVRLQTGPDQLGAVVAGQF